MTYNTNGGKYKKKLVTAGAALAIGVGATLGLMRGCETNNYDIGGQPEPPIEAPEDPGEPYEPPEAPEEPRDEEPREPQREPQTIDSIEDLITNERHLPRGGDLDITILYRTDGETEEYQIDGLTEQGLRNVINFHENNGTFYDDGTRSIDDRMDGSRYVGMDTAHGRVTTSNPGYMNEEESTYLYMILAEMNYEFRNGNESLSDEELQRRGVEYRNEDGEVVTENPSPEVWTDDNGYIMGFNVRTDEGNNTGYLDMGAHRGARSVTEETASIEDTYEMLSEAFDAYMTLNDTGALLFSSNEPLSVNVFNRSTQVGHGNRYDRPPVTRHLDNGFRQQDVRNDYQNPGRDRPDRDEPERDGPTDRDERNRGFSDDAHDDDTDRRNPDRDGSGRSGDMNSRSDSSGGEVGNASSDEGNYDDSSTPNRRRR